MASLLRKKSFDTTRLMLFQMSSIGFRSGLYGGRNAKRMSRLLAVSATILEWWIGQLSSIIIVGLSSVRRANGGQKGHHIVRFGRFWGFQIRIAVDRIESEEIGSEFIDVLHDCRFARRPQANGVRRGLRRALVLESYHEIVSVEGIQSILESFFKTASASAGRRWSRG